MTPVLSELRDISPGFAWMIRVGAPIISDSLLPLTNPSSELNRQMRKKVERRLQVCRGYRSDRYKLSDTRIRRPWLRIGMQASMAGEGTQRRRLLHQSPLPSYLLPSSSISTRSPLPSPALPPRLASSVTSRLLTTSQSKKTASSLMTTLLPQSFSSDLKLFVGNLPFNVDSAQVAQLFKSAGNVEMAEPLKLRQGEAEVLALESLFAEQGKVVEARVIYDRDSGRSKGFGFVTYNSAQEAQNAIRTLDGAVSDLDGRQIRVSEAEARPPRRQF
ncbi:hypothetical protein F2Q68_00017488 [Brassica cretica]|uniref:RRM domain-containing protein n=1 Tax=Brassica cretica TaxID=69181 RepID=A0A8S9HE12_BRACR|nr:hypothetical protein F2Q68_00017488 [Brassica cretica]